MGHRDDSLGALGLAVANLGQRQVDAGPLIRAA